MNSTMEECKDELLDSQFLVDNVGFLENCFTSSFSILQKSVVAVKEYLAEDKEFKSFSVNLQVQKKRNSGSIQSCLNLSIRHDNTQNQTQLAESKTKYTDLKDWGLPLDIVNRYKERGITKMFDWQVTCLSNPKFLMNYCNLVYSAPTSAGKTLVAEIATIKTVLERQKKVIIILPFVSIVREKTVYLQGILSSSGIRVEGFVGSQSPPGGLNAVHVAICTIEKANSLVNRLLDEGCVSELGAVIVDELHLLGDPSRGYILEVLLSKVMYISTKLDDVKIQIVGMSATLPNLEVLANWLKAELFITNFRPIPLDEYCLSGSKFYDKNGQVIRSLDHTLPDGDSVLKICLETISESCSILIFCMTKNRCENLAQSISSSFYKIGCSGNEMGQILRNELQTDSISEVLEQLQNCPVGLDHILKATISFGVAYHHAGLTFDERDIIEGGFKSGAIRVLVATSTLSSGVNLPARRVIIRTPVFQRQPINILTYKQMIGRAGRMGKDTKGESILICTEAEKKIGYELMTGALSPVISCIESEDKFMRAVLEIIASQIVCTKSELELYAKCTLLYAQEMDAKQSVLLKNTLDDLQNYELVRTQPGEDIQYFATPLGKACLSSSMAPNDGLSLFCELQKARQCLVLETDLHLIYLVTPYSVSNQWGEIDWLHLLTLWESLTKAMKRVGELVGIQESFIIRCLRGGNKSDQCQRKLSIHKRFYTALALQDLVNEVPLSVVATKFQCPRGFLQSLQQAAATFAGMVTAFCRQLGWKNLEMLISQFQDRLHFGIHSELLDLMKLPLLNGIRARSLFDCGFETVASIASGDIHRIENALHKAVPFQSDKVSDGDEGDLQKQKKIKNIWITGCCGLTVRQAAENLINEARKYLQLEIGVTDIKWNNIEVEVPKIYSLDYSDKKNTSNHNKIKSTNLCNSTPKTDSDEIVYLTEIDNSIIDTVADKSNINLPVKPNVKLEENIPLTGIVEKQTNDYTSQVLKDITNGNNESIIKKSNLWDSLNFTEISIENVAKNQYTNNANSSPNVSFGDANDKLISLDTNKSSVTKNVDIKDISLFSSEGDSSSIFEDSLPLDSIANKLCENDSLLKQNQHSNIDFTVNSKTVLNGFKSTLIEIDNNDHEDFKLVYDDELKAPINETLFESSIDIDQIDTQNFQQVSIKPCYVSPFKRTINISIEENVKIPNKKMKKEDNKVKHDSSYPILRSNNSMMGTIRIANFKITTYILRGIDVTDNMHVLDNKHDVAVLLDVKDNFQSTEVIGANIFKSTKSNDENINKEGFIKADYIYSITFCYDPGVCILLDLSSLDRESMAVSRQKLCSLFERSSVKWKYLSMQNMFVNFKRAYNMDLPLPSIDMMLVEWLIDSDERAKPLSYLVKTYCDIDLSIVSILVNDKERNLKDLKSYDYQCLRTFFIWSIAEKLNNSLLQRYENVQNTLDVEIMVLKILSNSEFFGVTVDKSLASKLLVDVQNSQETLQKKAFKICAYHFNFNSSKDVAKVLGIYNGRKISTKKSVLTAHNSPMASIIIYWRKLNSILTKTLYPLTAKACIYTEGDRIHPSYCMYTCTGRVSMHEPNLQNVPRTFSIPLRYLSIPDELSDDIVEFNCRNIFKAAPGHVLVSADYCQLEMRILTHYSEDPVLTKIMCSDTDVFKSIAAQWGGLTEKEVDEDLRQKAKQLCYGILYGMGNRSLAQQLDVTEIEAAMFMDSFYNSYPSVKAFSKDVVDRCKKKGYVETLVKRRRYLPDINSLNSSKRSAAERQALNTTIQGSAADIAKAAMCAIARTAEHRNIEPRLFLQMHDELIYEVKVSHKKSFISLLKESMEGTVKLKVPLPVKVKAGITWGGLEEVNLNEIVP